MCIFVYRITLPIHIMVAFIEKNFSKLKLIMFYLRSTMCVSHRLNEFALLSIEKELLNNNLNFE